jgi:hypothetical protein
MPSIASAAPVAVVMMSDGFDMDRMLVVAGLVRGCFGGGGLGRFLAGVESLPGGT